MAILNATPDSFYAPSRGNTIEEIVDRAGACIAEGADFLDIGGYSSRPGAVDISVAEEMDRLLPAVEAVHRSFQEIPVSVDTFRSEVAGAALDAGASIINDISGGGQDSAMWDLVARRQVPYVLMHMQGTPATMQDNPVYQDVIREVLDYFIRQVGALRELGVHDIIIDPGFGFGKNIAHNFQLLNGLEALRILGYPVLVGLSRKSMICRTLGVKPEDALNGTTALHLRALQQGARILRVHDPAPAREVIRLWQTMADHPAYTQ